jgi:hypothetical protein
MGKVWTEEHIEYLKELILNDPKIKPGTVAKDAYFRKVGVTAKQIRSRMALKDLKSLRISSVDDESSDEEKNAPFNLSLDDGLSKKRKLESLTKIGENGPITFDSRLLSKGERSTGITQSTTVKNLDFSLDPELKKKWERLEEHSKPSVIHWKVKEKDMVKFYFPKLMANETTTFQVDKMLKLLYKSSVIKPPAEKGSSNELLRCVALETISHVQIPDGYDLTCRVNKDESAQTKCFIVYFTANSDRFEELTFGQDDQ